MNDLAALEYPPPSAVDDEDEAASAAEVDLGALREELIRNAELAWDEAGIDPLLAELAAMRRQQLAAERQMRLLIAYAREFVGPRPYPLAALAEAAGMSISGVRTAYADDEIDEVARVTGARRRRPLAGGSRP